MRTSLTPHALRELMDKHLAEDLHRLVSALETKDPEIIQETFLHEKYSNIRIKHIEKYILSFQEREQRQHDFLEWTEEISYAAHDALVTLYEYAEAVLNEEQGEKEITELVVVEKAFASDDPDGIYRKRDDCLQQIFTARGLDTIITCELFQDPDDSSADTYLHPTIEEVLMEYERAASWQVAAQRQEKSPSDKWARYLARLRRAILDEAPAGIRAQLLFSQIRGAVEADDWEEGTAEKPGVARLAKELEGIGQPAPHGDNDYAKALQTLTGRAIAGIQDALKGGNPSDILTRLKLLDVISHTLSATEVDVGDALERTTPTAMARELLEQISRVGSLKGHKGERTQLWK